MDAKERSRSLLPICVGEVAILAFALYVNARIIMYGLT